MQTEPPENGSDRAGRAKPGSEVQRQDRLRDAEGEVETMHPASFRDPVDHVADGGSAPSCPGHPSAPPQLPELPLGPQSGEDGDSAGGHREPEPAGGPPEKVNR